MRKLKTHELKRLSTDEFHQAPKTPIVVVLDNVRSMQNVGAIFRTADAFRIKKIFLCGITATPPHREITKTALGAEESVAWEAHPDPAEAVKNLKGDGYVVIGAEQTDQSVLLQDFQPERNQKYCVVFGNEVFGVSDAVLAHVDFALEIPQYGTKHSLNLATSMGIIAWDLFRKSL